MYKYGKQSTSRSRNTMAKSTKFLVTSSFKNIEFKIANDFEPNQINVKWSRKFRSTDSIKTGSSPTWSESKNNNGCYIADAKYNESCKTSLKVTLHRNKKGGFEKKLYRYAVESIGYDEKVKTLASAELDLSEYADVSGSEQNIAIMLEPKKKYVLKAVLHLTLSFEFIRSGSSKDDDMISTWSRESLDLDAFTPDDQDESQGDDMVNLSVSSLVHTIRKHRTEVVLAVETQDFFESLSNCQLIVIVCNAEFTQISPELVATTNNFYAKAKARFGDSVELFYLSFDKNEDTFLASLQTHKLRCPAIKPFSKLHDTISQNYEITKVPYLTVQSQSKLVGCASNFTSISTILDAKSLEKRIYKWLQSSPEQNSVKSQGNKELDDKIQSLRERNFRCKSTIGHLSKKRIELNERISILRAERNIKGMLMKKGVIGLTKCVWRIRQFQYQNGKIIYLDPNKNKVKGEIPLSEVIFFDVLPKNKQGKGEANFNIVTIGRVYEIQARDKDHMNTWIDAAITLKQIDLFE